MREMAVHRLALLPRQVVQESFQQRAFAGASGPGHESQSRLFHQIVEPRQPFLHARVDPQGSGRDVLTEGLALELEVFLVHQRFLSFSRFCK